MYFDIKFTRQALRPLADIARLDIKRHEPGILFIRTRRTSDYDALFDVCVDSTSLATSFKKCNVIMTG